MPLFLLLLAFFVNPSNAAMSIEPQTSSVPGALPAVDPASNFPIGASGSGYIHFPDNPDLTIGFDVKPSDYAVDLAWYDKTGDELNFSLAWQFPSTPGYDDGTTVEFQLAFNTKKNGGAMSFETCSGDPIICRYFPVDEPMPPVNEDGIQFSRYLSDFHYEDFQLVHLAANFYNISYVHHDSIANDGVIQPYYINLSMNIRIDPADYNNIEDYCYYDGCPSDWIIPFHMPENSQ